MALDPRDLQLLDQARILVLATVRPDGRPHAVPLWFVWHEGRIYFGTDVDTVKVRNLVHRPEVAAVIERGGQEGASHAVLMEGAAERLPAGELPEPVAERFRAKYAWDPRNNRPQDTAVFVVTPRHLRAW